MPDSNNCFLHLSAVANFETRHDFCSILGENTAFCVYSVHVKYWCAVNSNLAYFIELTTALECQKQLLMSSISNLGGRESLEIAVMVLFAMLELFIVVADNFKPEVKNPVKRSTQVYSWLNSKFVYVC